jgi:AraC-like DNA-binding protein
MNEYGAFIPDVEYYVYRKCRPSWVIEPGVTDFHDLTYVVAGKGVYWVNRAETRVSAGDVVYIPPGSLREAQTSHETPMEVYAINFIAARGVTESGFALPFDTVTRIGHDPKVIGLFKQLTRVWMEREDLYRIDARALTMLVINELLRRLFRDRMFKPIDLRIESIKDFINENYQTELTVPLLAEKTGLCPVYLGALFMRYEACSISEYINKIRVNHALEILRTERLSVKETAYVCGYSDAFYFSRIFKKYTGVSPSQVKTELPTAKNVS